MSESRDRYVLLCQQALVFAAVAAVVAPAARVVSLDIVSPTDPAAQRIRAVAPAGDPGEAGALVASEPVKPTVTEIPMTGIAGVDRAGAARSLAATGTDPKEKQALTRPQPVDGFATVGVTWAHGEHVAEGAIEVSVRTLKNGVWTAWQPMEYHDDHGPDPGSEEARKARPGTEAFVVGHVDDVQVKAVTPDGTLPDDLKLALVDPGRTVAPTLERPAIDTAHMTAFESGNPADPGTLDDPTDPAEPVEPDDPAMPVAASTDVTPQPKIFSRAQWGADERMRDKSSLHYGEVHAGFVHHTVNANGYTKSEVPAIMRGIYAYHTQSKGWSDIGYNFLVDRFGRIWEGRYGGVGRPAVGAHTLGYNDYAFAMSAIGNFEIAKPSSAMLDAYGRLFAWKLSLHGIDASSTKQWVGSRYFQAINGHRDAGKTACPGKYLYAKLPVIRTLAASYQHSFSSRNLRTDISGSTWPDLVARDKTTNKLTVVRTGGQVRYLKAVKLASGFKSKDLIASPGDVNGDGYADIVARDRLSGTTTVYAGTSSGPLGGAIRTTDRFSGDDLLIGVGDFDGDGRNDLVGRDHDTKKLWLYPGEGGGSFGKADVLASDWTYNLTSGVGDFDGDGKPDLVARSGSGALYLVPGLRTRVGEPRKIGSSFSGVDLIAGRGDVTNDGKPDLLARSASSRQTRVFTGDGHGGLGRYDGPYASFEKLDWMSGGAQFAGSGAGDVVGRNGRGVLVAFANTGGRNISKIVHTDVSLADSNLVLNVGDWNHDGFGDVMTRTKAGVMQLLLGKGSDNFADPVVAATGWSGLRQVTSVGDVTGDGNNDLMARVGDDGVFKIYPGDGAAAIRAGYEAHSAVTSNRQVAAGLYDGDGAPDTMITKADGTLWFYPGNGPGGMTNGRKLLSGLGGYNWLVGLGDLDGDGHNDLLARRKLNGWLYLLPGKSGGFRPARFIATGFKDYDLVR